MWEAHKSTTIGSCPNKHFLPQNGQKCPYLPGRYVFKPSFSIKRCYLGYLNLPYGPYGWNLRRQGSYFDIPKIGQILRILNLFAYLGIKVSFIFIVVLRPFKKCMKVGLIRNFVSKFGAIWLKELRDMMFLVNTPIFVWKTGKSKIKSLIMSQWPHAASWRVLDATLYPKPHFWTHWCKKSEPEISILLTEGDLGS
jgi:hypothetical protein